MIILSGYSNFSVHSVYSQSVLLPALLSSTQLQRLSELDKINNHRQNDSSFKS